MADANRLERLNAPPIIEVICGIYFDVIPELDPVLLGTYWAARQSDFPRRELHPAVGRPGVSISHGIGPLRTWFVSPGGEFVLQVQPDRFYLNWRRGSGDYPRFSSDDGGLRLRALEEFAQLATFCKKNLDRVPDPVAVELGKIDHFEGDRHFRGKDDLARMLPSLAPVLSVTQTPRPDVNTRFREDREGHSLQVALASMRRPESSEQTIRLETTVVRPLTKTGTADLEAALGTANDEANAVFKALIPESERKARFMKE